MTKQLPIWLRVLGLVIAIAAVVLAVVNISLSAVYRDADWYSTANWVLKGLCIACLLAGGAFNIYVFVRLQKYKKRQEKNSQEVSREALNEEGEKVEE